MAGVAGPVTMGGAGASGTGVCATGSDESNACACANVPMLADGAVGGGAWGIGATGWDTGAGGIASAGAENGAPACIPLSKLWSRCAGARGSGAVGGAKRAPGAAAAGDAGSGAAAADGNRGVGIGGAPGAWGAIGVGAVCPGKNCGGVLRLLPMMFAGVAVGRGIWAGGRFASVLRLLLVIFVSEPDACPDENVSAPPTFSLVCVRRLLPAMFASEPGGLSTKPLT
jgi:hypothetical protein